MLDCIVVAQGEPSFREFLENILDYSDIPTIGCGPVTRFLKCDYYCINDKMNVPYLPNDEETIVVAHPRIWMEGFIRFDPNIKYGGTSGGLAVAFACTKFDHIGLVGFHGYGLPGNFCSLFELEVLNYWESKGKKFYSLMKDSVFNKRLLKC